MSTSATSSIPAHDRRTRAIPILWALALMAAWAFTLAPRASADPPRYRIIDLGYINEPEVGADVKPSSIARGVNNRGEVTGEIMTAVVEDEEEDEPDLKFGPFRQRAFVWLPTPNYGFNQVGMHLLGVPNWLDRMRGQLINIDGFVLGQTLGGVQGFALDGRIWDLATDHGSPVSLSPYLNNNSTRVRGINDQYPPQLSGAFLSGSGDRAFRMIYDPGANPPATVTILGSTISQGTSRGWRLSDSGLVPGDSESGSILPCYWGTECEVLNCQDGSYWTTMPSSGVLVSAMEPIERSRTVGRAANAADQIIGTSYLDGGVFCEREVVYWDSPTDDPEIVPDLPGASAGFPEPHAIAAPLSDGTVLAVGRSEAADAAVLWKRTTGDPPTWDPIDLNDESKGGDVIHCGNEEWLQLLVAYDINDHGWIVGAGERNVLGETRAFLMIPADYCSADLNGDFKVDVLDLLILLANWGVYSGNECLGSPDINASGSVDVQDLLILLANWGPCAGIGATILSLSEELDDAGLTQQQWNDYQAIMTGSAPQSEKDNWTCWMTNYLMQCKNCPVCPGRDPFAN